MFSGFRAPLGAMLILALGAGAAFAGSAVSSADMVVREGPGDEFKVLWTVAAGSQVDLRECNAYQWCLVVQRDNKGWVHVQRVDEAKRRKGGGPGATGDGSDTDLAELPGTPGGKKGSTDRKSPKDGNSGISGIDGASLPGSTTTGRERSSQSGGSTMSGGNSGSDGQPASAAATASLCMRC